MNLGEVAIKLTQAAAQKKPFPSDVDPTPENKAMWHAINVDIAKMPPGMVVEVPWDWTLTGDDEPPTRSDDRMTTSSVSKAQTSVVPSVSRRAVVVHTTNGAGPLDAAAVDRLNPHAKGTTAYANFAKSYYQGAHDALAMTPQGLDADIRATTTKHSNARHERERALYEGRLSALHNEAMHRQRMEEQAQEAQASAPKVDKSPAKAKEDE